MLRQFHSSWARDCFCLRQREEKWRAGFGLLGAGFGNNLRIDVGKAGRRFRAIKFQVPGCGKNNLPILRQKIYWFLVPEQT